MFEQATNKIYNMERIISETQSRVAQCENNIYRINNDIYDDGPLWSKVRDNNFKLGEVGDTVVTLDASVNEFRQAIEELTARVQALESAIGASAVERTENQKQKIDLEISEQNGYIDLDDVKNEKGIWELYDDKWINR